MVNLEGKVVIVTGASSGIGVALVRCFSERRAHVTLTARRVNRFNRFSDSEACQSL